MSEKVKFDQLIKNNQKMNISKAKSLTQKSKIIRNAHTPIKAQSSNKIYINNNSNTMINPNNNYNINNNISININIDMTNERNKSFNLKNKNRSKPNKLKKDKIILNNNNNNLIYNTVKNFQNKSNAKKSPFHIRIKSANLTIKDFKYKPRVNTRNKVYQNRLNHYYNISNKNNFNIFTHKFETKIENNTNKIENENKNNKINHTPVIAKTNKIYKDKKTKKEKSKDNSIIKNKNNINNNDINNIKKYLEKRKNFSPGITNKNNINNKNKINIQNNISKQNNSIDNRKIKNNKNINKIINLKKTGTNYRNMSFSPLINHKKGINKTIDYGDKNKINKNNTIIKTPFNSKPKNNIFKNNNKINGKELNFRSPMLNNKNMSKINKKNKLNIKKEKNIAKIEHNNEKIKEKEKENKKEKIKEKENKNEKEDHILHNQTEIIKENNNINDKLEEEKDNIIKEDNKNHLSPPKELGNDEEEKKEEKLEKKEEKEEKKEEKEKEEPNIQSDIYAELFLDKIFQSSIAQNIDPQPLNKNRILQIESICKVGYAGPGVKKKNQDNFFIYKKFLNDTDITFLGVCDGHGMFGHDISGYLVNMLPQNLNNNFTKGNIKTINNDNEYDKISDIISNTYVQTNMNLVNNSSIDCTYSGSTCTSLIISSEKIISINVGDSRCVLGKYINNKWLAQNLTRDHKPTEEDEKKRIIDKGGRIEAYKDDSGEYVGPERVWLKGEDLPGLAMSRSFGDDVAHMIGVTSKPEIKEFKLTEEDKFILLGSDGIFEFISSDDSVNMVKDFYLKNDINGALNHLYKTSSQKWIMEEEVIDDITLIIIFLK